MRRRKARDRHGAKLITVSLSHCGDTDIYERRCVYEYRRRTVAAI